jgi:hypothetical protein
VLPFVRDACGACDEDLMGQCLGCDVITSHGVQTTWNPLEPPSKLPRETGGVVLLGNTMGRTFLGGEVAIGIA